MAEKDTVTGTKRKSIENEDDLQDGPTESKKPKLEEAKGSKTPGKKTFTTLNKTLKQLESLGLTNGQEPTGELLERIQGLVKTLETACTSPVEDGETPHPLKLIQAHLKHKLFNSENIKDGDNIKNFLSGLEDGSASKSDSDDKVFVFLANFATELWYNWNEDEGQWQWTPEDFNPEKQEWWLWMPCSRTTVTAGQWEGETPAPENVEIINYLDAVRPIPSDGEYIPDSHNVLELLSKLVTLKDEEIVERTRTILKKLADQEVESKSSHVVDFKSEVSKLLSPAADAPPAGDTPPESA